MSNSGFQETVAGYTVLRYGTVSSTNDLAKEIAKEGKEERIAVVAETQAVGRGRLGRRWISPEGGLWLSLIMRPRTKPREAPKLTFVASSAVAKTIQSIFGLETEVKWPNDVLVKGRKICGILTESSTADDVVLFAVIGVGINANIDLKTFPEDLRGSLTSLKQELNCEVNLKRLMTVFLQNFESRYKHLEQKRWNMLLQEWKKMAMFLGKQVEVASFDEVFAGEAWDIDDDGALIIRFGNGVLRKVVAADVTLRTQSSR